jgi:serine/threonine protein kinase
LNEVRLLSNITSEYVIGFNSAFFDSKTEDLHLMMQYACNLVAYLEEGDLAQKIEKCVKNVQLIPEYDIWIIIEHLSKGLSHLHQNNILHRDLKTANVF